MQEKITLSSNSRCLLIVALAVAAFLLAIAESDSPKVFVASKLLAIIAGAACHRLAKHWGHSGKIDEIIKTEE